MLTAYTGNSLSLGALLQLLHQDGSGGLVAELRTESGKSLLHLACEAREKQAKGDEGVSFFRGPPASPSPSKINK